MALHLSIQPISLFPQFFSSGWKRPSTKWAQLFKTTAPKSANAYSAELVIAGELYRSLWGSEANSTNQYSSLVWFLIRFFSSTIRRIHQTVIPSLVCSNLKQSSAFSFVTSFFPMQCLAFF